MPRSRLSTPRPPLDAAALRQLALGYLGRYATTRARLEGYLRRKLAASGWAEEGAPPVEAIAAQMAELGYLDDQAFAAARTRSLLRRGYGGMRVTAALRAAGVSAADAAAAAGEAEDGAEAAAIAFARRRRIGPFATAPADAVAERRAFGAMLRAGHSPAVARKVLKANFEDDETGLST